MEQHRIPYGVAALVAVLGAVFSWPYLDPLFSRTLPVDSTRHATIQEAFDEQEVVFEVPVPANWEGSIIAVMVSGQAYAIERDDGQRFYAFLTDPPTPTLEGRVSVRGLWTGTTCAYQNTIFDGRCVPDVTVRTIIPAPLASSEDEVSEN